MPSTTDPQDYRGLFSLFKGESGSGKSVAALSFPEPYLFDFDKKMPSIAQKHFPGKKVDWDTFSDVFTVAEKIEEFSRNCPYETLIFDSITSLVNLCLNSIGQTKGEEVMKQIRTRTKGGNLELMSIDYYNGETNFIQRYFIDACKSLWQQPGNPKHVIITAHVMTVEFSPDLKTKVITKARSIVTAGKRVAAFIPTQFDDMYHFGYEAPDPFSDDKTVKHVVSTEAIGEDNAKCSMRLPGTIDFTNCSFYEQLLKWNPGLLGSSDEDLTRTTNSSGGI